MVKNLQGMPVTSLVWEDPPCHATTAWEQQLPEPCDAAAAAWMPRARALQQEKPLQWETQELQC